MGDGVDDVGVIVVVVVFFFLLKLFLLQFSAFCYLLTLNLLRHEWFVEQVST